MPDSGTLEEKKVGMQMFGNASASPPEEKLACFRDEAERH